MGQHYKAVELLDQFTKVYCRDDSDIENHPLKFRCQGCEFQRKGFCLIKVFAYRNEPTYLNFGSMSR